MRIFLTGFTGFVGSNFVLKFANKYSFYLYYRDKNLLSELDNYKPDAIINCAAEIYDSSKMVASNVELTKTLLDWVLLNPSTTMIQLGSSSEYGPCNYPTSEQDPIKAKDPYGLTKGLASQLCKSYGVISGLDVVVVRPYSPYGPGESARRLFPRLWQSFKLNKPMTLVQGVHDFCYIDDLINAIDVILNSEKRIPGDYINVSSGVETTNMEVYELFKSITGSPGAVTIVDDFCTPKVWKANIEYVRNVYGWQPTVSLEDGIRQFLAKANYE